MNEMLKKIYIAHATSFDFENELYAPLRASEIAAQHELIFPHDTAREPINSKAIIAVADLIVAEVSYPSMGVGIELGWADAAGKKIICIYRTGTKISSSLEYISCEKIEYSDGVDLVAKLNRRLQDDYVTQ
jgi:hypothetical protein